jgi:hypothetical protein
VSFVLLAYDEAQQHEAEAMPLEGPSLGDEEPGTELGEAYTNLRAALRDGDPLQKRLQLSAEEGGASLGKQSDVNPNNDPYPDPSLTLTLTLTLALTLTRQPLYHAAVSAAAQATRGDATQVQRAAQRQGGG